MLIRKGACDYRRKGRIDDLRMESGRISGKREFQREKHNSVINLHTKYKGWSCYLTVASYHSHCQLIQVKDKKYNINERLTYNYLLLLSNNLIN